MCIHTHMYMYIYIYIYVNMYMYILFDETLWGRGRQTMQVRNLVSQKSQPNHLIKPLCFS